MIQDNFKSGKEARDLLIAGADKIANAVKGTLGAAGYNYLSEHTLNPNYITSNDGVQLANALILADPYEQLGARIMQEIGSRADKGAHDGTTTSITLAQAIIHEAKDLEVSPMELKNSLETCIPLVEEALKAQAKEIDVSEVGKVATVSSEDESIGNTIQEIYEQIGKDGIIFNDASSQNFKDTYEIDKGVHIEDSGFAHPYMGDMKDGQMYATVDIKNPLIVVTTQKINTTDDINILGTLAKNQDRELVIFCDEIEQKALEQMITTRFKSQFRTTVFKFPILWKDWWIEDIAKLTGATVIAPALGLTLNKFQESYFGGCNRIMATGKTQNSAGDTFLDGTKEIPEYIQTLFDEGSDENKLRAARLNKKTARYHVGALSEQALKYRHDKCVDALGSAYQALHGGVLPGGGTALFRISNILPDSIGGKILKEALKSPMYQIIRNSGKEISHEANNPEGTIYVDGADFQLNRGYDAKTGKLVDMLEAGIVDAYPTVLSSFKSAISVAATILTAQVVTLLPKQQEKAIDPFNPYAH